MPVPGLTPELPLRAKVRIGQRVQGTRPDGSKYERAASLDYFLCPDADFIRLVGEKPKTLRVLLPYATVADVFPSGLEKWAKTQKGAPILLCYTKGDGTAHGLGGSVEGGRHVKLDPKEPRQAFQCPAHDCNFYGKGPKQGCRPQARLNFLLPGGPRDAVYRFETKGLDTIQGITGVLSQYADLRGIEFELSIAVVKKGNKQYPAVSIREISGASGEAPGEATPSETGSAVPGSGVAETLELDHRRQLASILRQLGQYPPNEDQTAWIAQVGYGAAIDVLTKRLPE